MQRKRKDDQEQILVGLLDFGIHWQTQDFLCAIVISDTTTSLRHPRSLLGQTSNPSQINRQDSTGLAIARVVTMKDVLANTLYSNAIAFNTILKQSFRYSYNIETVDAVVGLD